MYARLGSAALTVAAIVYLHLTLSVFYWLLDPSLGTVLTPTWELAGLMALLLGWAWRSRGSRRGRSIFLAILTVLVTVYLFLGVAQGFALREFGYDVILALHLPYVPELFRMMYKGEPLYMFILYVVLLFGGTFLVLAGIYLAMRRVVGHLAEEGRYLAGAGATFTLYLGLAIPLLGIHEPLSRALVNQVDMAMNMHKRLDATGRKMATEALVLRKQNPFKDKTQQPTIFIFIVESYGQVLFHDPAFADFRDFVRNMAQELEQSGYHIRSRYMNAPVFGGSSWMADASLLCGVKVHNQRRYESLQWASIPCLPQLMNEAGYRSILAAPNITWHDPRVEKLFPFTKSYIRDDFQYAGPRFTWSYMADQYVIHFVHERELAKRPPEPLFVTYILTNSHHPWNRIPIYVKDWSTLGNGAIYHKMPVKRFKNSFVSGEQFKPAFQASIEYVLQTVKEYIKTLPDQDAVILILGDHQPRKPIALMDRDPWSVPIHVLSRDPAQVERFAKIGYVPGIEPDPAAPVIGMEYFVQDLFRAFSKDQQAAAPAP